MPYSYIYTAFTCYLFVYVAFPWVINGLMEARVSYNRLAHFLFYHDEAGGEVSVEDMEDSEDTDTRPSNTRSHAQPPSIRLDGASFTWNHRTQASFELMGLNLHLDAGDILAITGPV